MEVIGIVGILAVVAVALFLIVHYDRKRRRKRRAQARCEENQQVASLIAALKERDALGERLFSALIAAANANPRQLKDLQLQVGRIKNNAGGYSVLVQRHDLDGTAVGSGYQFDIYLDRLHYFCGLHQHGDVNSSQFDDFLELAVSKVKAYGCA